MQYCLWRASLTPQRAAKLDEFLAAQSPGAKLGENFRSFRFTAPPPGKDPQDAPDPAKEMLTKILAAIEGKDAPPAKPAD